MQTNRREFLSSALLVAAAFSQQAKAEEKLLEKKFRNPNIYQFFIGDIEAFSISDGESLIRSEDLSVMYPAEDRGKMVAALEENFERKDGVPLYVNVLVLRRGKEVAVFDAGFGAGFAPNFGWLFEALATVRIAPTDVTHTFLSHAHIDHIGGFVNEGKATFPNAAFIVMKEEVDFWFQNEPDFSRSHRNKNELPGLIKGNREKFEILKPHTQFAHDGMSFWNGAITVEHAPGHTLGHAMFRISSKGESLLHIMDVAHHYVLMFANPAWTIGFDHEPEIAVATRKKVFAKETSNKTRLYGFHLPFPGIGRIISLPDQTYRWLPERYNWGI